MGVGLWKSREEENGEREKKSIYMHVRSVLMWIRKNRKKKNLALCSRFRKNFKAMHRNVCIYNMIHFHFSLCPHSMPFDFKFQTLVALASWRARQY